ncbi:glycine cleavage system H-protein subunit [Cystobasidiomycetes sp. EMM_F5]
MLRVAAVRPIARVLPQQTFRPIARGAALRQQRWASTKVYTEDHEWVEYDTATVSLLAEVAEDVHKSGTVGITDYAQKALGDVVFVELPAKGSDVTKQDQIGAVESVKAASDIFAPVSGKITEINDALGDQPSLLNRDPEGAGWLCKIELKDADEMKDLMDAEAYQAHCEGKN